jgi:hypothetical protein
MRFISRVLRIQNGEGRLAALVVALMFVAMAAFTIGQSGITLCSSIESARRPSP